MSNLSTLPKGDSAWLLRKAIERIIQQVSVLETNIGASTSGNSANTQIIFNDAGVLRGDTGLTYNKTTDTLTAGSAVITGAATISGDLTVHTSTLKVDSTNHRVGIGTASPSGIFHAANLGTAGTTADNFNGYFSSANRNSNVYILAKNTEGSNLYFGDGESNTVGAVIYDHTSNYMRFDVNGSEQMRLSSTGLGITGALTVNGSGRFQAAGANWMEFGVNVLGSNQATGAYIRSVVTSAGNPTYSWTGDTDTGLFNDTANTIGFAVGGTPAMTLSSGGLEVVQSVSVRGANIVRLYNSDNTNQFQIYNGGATGASNANLIFLSGAVGERMRINPSGNLAFPTGKGIDFSAVTGGTGTATANVLNDYEEGTFTPTVIGTTADGTIGTYYAQSGIYTKVGRAVTVQVYLAWGGGTGATGDLAFAGLPFTTGNIANNYTSGAIGYFGDIALTALNVPSLFASPNTTRFLVNQFPVGGGGLTAVPYDVNGAIMFTATYFTA